MLRIGMIGAGFIGQIGHLANFAEIQECQVTAIADLRPKLLSRVAERYRIPEAYSTHQELLASNNVDAVVVVVPRAQTAGIVIDCLRARKHVFSEKPMAGTVEQGECLLIAAKFVKRRYMVGYMKRYDAGVQRAKAILSDLRTTGELGAILHASAHCYMGDSYASAGGNVVTDEVVAYSDGSAMAPEWLPEPQRAHFAAYVNTYSHTTNLLRYLFGLQPEVEYANLSGSAQTVVLGFGKFTATLETGRTSHRAWDEYIEIYFQHGRLSIRLPPPLLRNVPAAVELYKAGQTQEVIAPQIEWSWAFKRQAEAFVADVQNGTGSLVDAAEALEDLKLIEDMWRPAA